jgi:predicted  nucleic acid-binding Zn-ribbon protein
LKAKNELLKLLRIQELAQEIREAERILGEAPGLLEEIENRFRERNAEYVAVKDRYDALETDQRTRSGELTTLEESRKKFMDDLMQVKNQREYAAMLKEIDSVKAQIAEHEDAILKDMEEIEKLTDELKQHEEHIRTEREKVEVERNDVETKAADAKRTIEALRAERGRHESELPRNVLTTLRQLEATRQGIFLSKAENGTCLSCFVRVRPQVFQEIRLAAKIHTCDSCRRFLYHEPSLRENPDPTTTGGEVEALNGGTV